MRIFTLALISALVSTAGAASIKVGGGAAPINNIFRKVQEHYSKKTGNVLVITEEGPDLALKAVSEGKIDIASAGLAQEDWFKMMDEKKLEVTGKDQLKFRVIGKDLVKVITHSGIKLDALTNAQMKDLFTGKTKNWKEIGGPDQKVQVVFGEKIPGTHKFLAKKIMNDEEYAKERVVSGTAPEVIEKVKTTPGAIGLAPMGLDLAGTNVPKIEVLGRPISVATKGVPSKEILELFTFIEKEGQQYLPK